MIEYAKGKILASIVALLIFFILIGILFLLNGNKQNVSTRSEITNPTASPAVQSAEPTVPSRKVYKIMIDPGHGDKNTGAIGFSGIMEKDINLSIALKLNELLKKDSRFEVQLTRSDDTFIELEDRAALSNEWNADAFISIHANYYKDPSISGTETYYLYENSLPLAEAVHEKMVEAMGFDDRGVRKGQWRVLSLNNSPAILLEIGYLSNAAEEAIIISDEGQDLAAQAIADGLNQYILKLSTKG